MIPTGQPALGYLPKVQRRATVAAHIEECAGAALRIPEQNYRFVANSSSQRLFGNLIGPSSNVPSIADEHLRALPARASLSSHRLASVNSVRASGKGAWSEATHV